MSEIDTTGPTSEMAPLAKPKGGAGLVRRAAAATTVVLAALLFTATALPSPASAAQVTYASGWAGAVIPVGRVQNTMTTVFDRGLYVRVPAVSAPGTYAYRPAGLSGAVVVSQSMEMLRWNGSRWVAARTATRSATMAANSSVVAFPTAVASGLTPGYYQIRYSTAWGGYGVQQTVMNAAGDYSCTNINFTCGAGWIYVW